MFPVHELRDLLLLKRLPGDLDASLEASLNHLDFQRLAEGATPGDDAIDVDSPRAQAAHGLDEERESLLLHEAARAKDAGALPGAPLPRRGEVTDVDSTIGDATLLVSGTEVLEEVAVEGGDADNEVRAPDLVFERYAVAEEIRGMPGEAERLPQ